MPAFAELAMPAAVRSSVLLSLSAGIGKIFPATETSELFV
jgi:hypothetical protein